METIQFEGEVGSDGKLRLEMDLHLPPGRVEGVVVVHQVPTPSSPPFDTLAGLFAAELSPDADIDADLKEMRDQWVKSLELPR
ncbi:MAG TPA: hypothetical protein VG269_10125 [Tepidisphaeraceae bacterium]|jgi:hypothetical protein|nr:hypothetical protein [Tepidisphaeraceae bacterium]